MAYNRNPWVHLIKELVLFPFVIIFAFVAAAVIWLVYAPLIALGLMKDINSRPRG